MNQETFIKAVRFVVRRNINEHVVAATATYGDNSRKMTINYYIDRIPQQDEIEERQIAETEMLADFPEIGSVEGACFEWKGRTRLEDLESLVFLRGAGSEPRE